MKKNRLMLIEYRDARHVERLKTCLDMCGMPHAEIKECEFVGGGELWRIYISRGKCTWKQVTQEINRVKAVKARYISGAHIEEGKVYIEC